MSKLTHSLILATLTGLSVSAFAGKNHGRSQFLVLLSKSF